MVVGVWFLGTCSHVVRGSVCVGVAGTTVVVTGRGEEYQCRSSTSRLRTTVSLAVAFAALSVFGVSVFAEGNLSL